MQKILLFIAVGVAFAISFTSCVKKDKLSETEITTYIAQGDSISQLAFKALSSRLQKAIQDSGAAYAVQYCNLVALPLTDSIGRVSGTVIRRTSLQWRNEQNKPTAAELDILRAYESDIKAGNKLLPGVRLTTDNKVLYTAPIMIMPLCLNCHGEPGKDISAGVMDQLSFRYPADKATGYHAGDWRGMWSITLQR